MINGISFEFLMVWSSCFFIPQEQTPLNPTTLNSV